MFIDHVKLAPWDGQGYVVLSQSYGFNFSERRYKEGVSTDDFVFCFNKSAKVSKKKMIQVMSLLLEDEEEEQKEIFPVILWQEQYPGQLSKDKLTR